MGVRTFLDTHLFWTVPAIPLSPSVSGNKGRGSGLFFYFLEVREYHSNPYPSFFSTKVLFFTQFFRYLLNIANVISPILQVILSRLNFPLNFLRYSSNFFSIFVSISSVFVVDLTWLLIGDSNPHLPKLLLFFFSSFHIFPHLLQRREFRRLYTFLLEQTGQLISVSISSPHSYSGLNPLLRNHWFNYGYMEMRYWIYSICP